MNANAVKPDDALAIEIVTSVVREMSVELSYPSLRDAAADTPLYGGAHGIDSLSLVRIVAEVERKTEERTGKRVVLADERAMSRRSSPFRTVSTLADLLAERIRE